MPKEKYKGPDPDPTNYLFVSLEDKRQDQIKPYDAKKSCWVPSVKEGFRLGEIVGAKGDQVTVKVEGKDKQFKKDLVMQVNPPKFEKCEDMSNLTYLNEASVLWNLKARYYKQLIYTYSGLFCIAVNPYRKYPIYTQRVVDMYKGKRRGELPPHVFAVSDVAYVDMLNNKENQSMLITGESGAGKTENTKKVISYFAKIGANVYREVRPGEKVLEKANQSKKGNLEDQVVQTNPVLEAFGNAKTVRNDNSSRFGKFIRIHFSNTGRLAGADIETYLLEKARVIAQQPNERSYHIFYQIMSNGIPGLKESVQLPEEISYFPNQSMGTTYIDGVDDKEEMEITDNCMDVLGFEQSEKDGMYQIVSAVMHLGTVKFKQRGRDEQAEADGTKEGEIVSSLLGLSADDLYFNLLKPKIKVGTEFVTQGRNKNQVHYSVGALCKAMFERLFKWLVNHCNKTLSGDSSKRERVNFIGVLDIAGFEIFTFNSFEQLCINFTNEKLQQFFNHHMFILEQEEYQREGIQWTFIDFGLDLQACIDLIEKPLGIFSILEEESMFPKATDKSFAEKLNTNHLGKSNNFVKPKMSGGKKDASVEAKAAHFAVVHYAGTVGYNLSGWLEKNKDPLNDTVVDQFKNGAHVLLQEIFEDHPGQCGDEVPVMKGGRRQKGSTFQTVSCLYREQVHNLMETLRATAPHFIRCIIPNEEKKTGVIDSPLVMHQLTCNGVLEGIRICRKGFPNRMMYADFKLRYRLLAPVEIADLFDAKDATQAVLSKVALEDEKYRMGHTKVFFRSGVLGYLEELRDEKIKTLVTLLQAGCRGYLGKRRLYKILERQICIVVCQRALRYYINVRRDWLWWKLFSAIQPLLKMGEVENLIKEMENRLAEQLAAMKKDEEKVLQLEANQKKIEEEKKKMEEQLEEQQEEMKKMADKEREMAAAAKKREEEIMETKEKLREEEERRNQIEAAKRKQEQEMKGMKKEMDDMELAIQKAEQDKASKQHQINALNDEVQKQEEAMIRANKEKKQLQEANQKQAEELQAAEDRANHMNKVKNKLEAALDDMEDSLEREKRERMEQEKQKQKVENELKLARQSADDWSKREKELEAIIARKNKELSSLGTKLDQEQTEVARGRKQAKEAALRAEELEEEVEAERQGRAKAEKQKAELARDLQDLQERLEEAGGLTTAQMELNKKREADLAKMKSELEQSSVHHEAALAAMRKRNNEALAELGEQIDNQNKQRQRLEKEKQKLLQESNEARQLADRALTEKANLERDMKMTQSSLQDAQLKLGEASRNLADMDAARRKQDAENNDLLRQLAAAENQISQLGKLKTSLSTQLEDTKKFADDETREKIQLMSRCKALEREFDQTKKSLENEQDNKEDLLRQLARVTSDCNLWKSKYENEALSRIEDLDNTIMKLQLRLAEAEDTIDGLQGKCESLEKSKQRLIGQIDDLEHQVDQANHLTIQLEKQAKNFDKVIAEWKMKVEDLNDQLENSKKENREIASELYRVKSAYDDQTEEMDNTKRENKNLSDEIKDLLDQIGEGGRSLHEVEKERRRLEMERDELQAALEEAEAALEQEENRYVRAQTEIGQMRQEMKRKLKEKDEEFETSRRNLQRLIESLQASLEAESKGKAEALRMKKKLENDINELEIALDNESKHNADLQKEIKRHLNTIKDLQQQLEDESRLNDELREHVSTVERRANALANEVEEARTLLEQAQRARSHAELELADAKDQVNEVMAHNQALSATKRRLENEFAALQADFDECATEMRNSDEKAKKAMLDALRLSDELRSEQDHSQREEALRRGLEAHVKELGLRLEDAEANCLRGGKKLIEKLEAKIRQLSHEIDTEMRLRSEANKQLKRADRKMKEFEFQAEEDRKNNENLEDIIEQLQYKIRTYRKQVEDAEEIAALNLAKYRKAQADAEEADERANLTEQALNKVRAKSVMSGGGML